MPEGIAVEIENGFATIAPSPEKVNDVVTALLATTPAELIEQNTRSGPGIQYVVPEGNARAAGLIDEESLAAPVLDRADLGYAADLQDADPLNHEGRDWQHPVINVADTAYVNGRDGENGIRSGPLHFAEPATSVPGIPAAAEETIEQLRARIQANSIQPADYAPQRSTPVPSRVPGGQATIASVISTATETISQAVADAIEAVAEASETNYDDGKPDADWSRKRLNEYAVKLGLDPKQYSNAEKMLAAIREIEPA